MAGWMVRAAAVAVAMADWMVRTVAGRPGLWLAVGSLAAIVAAGAVEFTTLCGWEENVPDHGCPDCEVTMVYGCWRIVGNGTGQEETGNEVARRAHRQQNAGSFPWAVAMDSKDSKVPPPLTREVYYSI